MTRHELLAEWRFARGLTLDLLDRCSDADLQFALNGGSPLWKQFRHIGRVQEDYLSAIETGVAHFDARNGSYRGDASRAALRRYLEAIDRRLDPIFETTPPEQTIDWFGEAVSTDVHLCRLLTHETLHHGQLMLSWRALGHRFPASWASWGEA